MIRINLLPFRAARKKENVRRQLTVFFLSMTLLVVAVFAVQLWLSSRVSSLDNKLKQTQAELAAFGTAQRIDELDAIFLNDLVCSEEASTPFRRFSSFED